MRKARVFILIDWFSPAFRAGGPIQSIANLIRSYPSDQVEFRVFTSCKDHDGSELDSVPWDCWHRFASNTEVWYASKATLRIRTIQTMVRTWKPDTVFLNGLFSIPFNLLPALFLKHPHMVLAARGMLHPGALSLKSRKKQLYLRCWKWLGLHRKLAYHAAAPDEVVFIQQQFGTATRIFLAPNYPRVLPYMPASRLGQEPLRIVSIALVSPMKNHLLVLEQLESVTVPIMWTIYGPIKDATYWDTCLAKIARLPAHIQVVYGGELTPDAVPEALINAHVFVLPSKSENFGHAIFEALSAGKPVLTSTGTPWNNLQMMHAGYNVDVECHPSEIGTYLEEVFYWSAEQWHRSCTAARQHALEAISFDELEHAYSSFFFPHGN
jgi:glycosyltransferase involved in cell wall biosynthesis